MAEEMLTFKVIEKQDFVIVHFNIEDVISREILHDLKPPKVKSTNGVLISGRGPVWLFCYLAHFYHPTRFVATHDPRLGGGVVVATHTPEVKVGELLEIEEID